MASFIKSDSSRLMYTPSPSKESLMNEVFLPRGKVDQPCDVVLVVENGKEFKAHRKVLSEASPFFEKLLNSDMKESKEGVVRFEMFSESVMAATLEFIYTGHVQVLDEDNARDLIVIADYLFLQKLKTLAERVFAQKLNIPNCIPTFHFCESYQCEELHLNTRKFIIANFTAVYAANREDVLNMSSKEIKMWISSDEINVSSEEDVFNFILAWIDHDQNKRKKDFAELFFEVRLVYVSRDFLISDVVTNDLVTKNKECLDLVTEALDSIDSKDCDNVSINLDILRVPPRKSLETPVILTVTHDDILYYCPDEDSWFCLAEVDSIDRQIFGWGDSDQKIVPCHGKLYTLKRFIRPRVFINYTNSCEVLPALGENRVLEQIFVNRNEDEIYALVSERSANSGLSTILKYEPAVSYSWEDVSSWSWDLCNLRRDVCIVAKDNFIYFIGGTNGNSESMSNVDRYDLSKSRWDKAADIQVARSRAHGAAAYGKIFVAGGDCYGKRLPRNVQCEVYDETLNEWQFIKCFDMKPKALKKLLSVDDKLYAVGFMICEAWQNWRELRHIRVECYNSEKNVWAIKSEIATRESREIYLTGATACSFTIFKGSAGQLVETSPTDCLSGYTITQTSFSPKARQRQCFII